MRALLDGERDPDAMLRGLRKSGVLIALSHNDRKIYPALQMRGACATRRRRCLPSEPRHRRRGRG
ncbi:MAG: hypothetical protein ACTHJJ_06345 [Intrasporangium sp.]|uniref:hypothetical protein n=1 Tax=Intrasporangium sp. TaxID=1925024 RepID=UPI003F815555